MAGSWRRLGLGQRGILDAPLPKGLSEPTLYARFGDCFLFAMMMAAAGVGVGANVRRVIAAIRHQCERLRP
jgi:apolipoprotein N-acyltransferase